MIKFFRKIRQKLLAEGKLKSYTFYAIGEIFLVVVGILIALQINNWNQVRKDRSNEILLLLELRESLSQEATQFAGLIEKIERSRDAYDALEKFVRSEPIEDEALYKVLGDALTYSSLDPITSAYETLKTSRVSLRNRELRALLGTYYEKDQVLVASVLDDNGWYFKEYMVPYIREHIAYFSITVKAIPHNRDDANMKAELLKNIPTCQALQGSALYVMGELMTRNEELLQLIDEETGYKGEVAP